MDKTEMPPGSPAIDQEELQVGEAEKSTSAVASPAADTENAMGDFYSDDESELEELDEKEFEDIDPNALNIPDKPIAVDADNVALLGVHKRKRTEDEDVERKKKKKQSRRAKGRKERKDDGDDDFVAGEQTSGKRERKSRAGTARRATARISEVNEELLTPEERRRRDLDRRMDEALQSHRPRARRRGDVDLEVMADREIENMRQRMAKACELDSYARANNEIATHKLEILPEVVELLNKNTIQSQLVDPDINLLEAVRFMLEPANQDAALPNYRIQRELFSILGKLPIGKEALVASGIGKVVLFYTKSIQPQPEIKRQAEKLMTEWMGVVLGKRKDHRSLPIETRRYDPQASAFQAASQGLSQTDRLALAAEKRQKILAQPTQGRRVYAEDTSLPLYKYAPVNNLSNITNGRSRGGRK
ncbi:hypothetical protein K470DRAFT_234859 [Piedraia hortae CBS 480.64]|uniref:TFIIS N-terminal domain-containing protein n=1 Tax=Piedraia hortae CBS 480.64 TaxID=1314780 RepID=A0A6A7BXG6_9PEZI|nr:hypothetical protein K470DRAFT_234859 [Piedraia hortae CBS 480.64]